MVRLDQNNITARLKELAKYSVELQKKALGQMGLRIIRDMVLDAPRPPLRTGFLRGSGVVYLESKKVLDSTQVGGNSGAVKGDIPETNPEPEPMTLTVAFNTPYAANMDQNLSPEGSLKSHFENDGLIGVGFMSTKVASKNYQDTWYKIASNVIKEGLDGK